MSQFEFFMTFYSLLLGLGLAELLLGFANLLRNRARPQLGLLTPLLGVIVLLQLLVAFLGAFEHLDGIAISMESLALPTILGILLFVVCVIVVPRDPTEWASLDDYFLTDRRWSAGLLVAINLLVLCYETPDISKGALPAYIIINLLAFALLGCILLARSRRLLVFSMTLLILLMVNLYTPYSIMRPLAVLTS